MFDYLFESSFSEYTKPNHVMFHNVRTKVPLGDCVEANRWFSFIRVNLETGIMTLHQGNGCIKVSLTLNFELLKSNVTADTVMEPNDK